MANLSSKTGTVTTPVQTQISIANNSTTSVQDMSAYDAQEVMGFVYIDATTDLRAYFTVTVVKNGAGTYEIAGADIAGDQSGTGGSAVAPVSFGMSGSILQVTVPNLTGFTSGFLRYQLSAPFLGGNYPLTVSARQVAGDVSGVAVPAGMIGERLTATGSATNIVSTATWYQLRSLTLTPGVWLIYADFTFGASVNGTIIRTHGCINTTSASGSGGLVFVDVSVGPTTSANISLSCMAYVNISASTVYYANGLNTFSSGTYNGNAVLSAVRIA